MSIRQAYLVKSQTSTGAGQPKRWDMPSGTVTIECLITSDPGTTCTALTIDLEGSISNVNYFALARHVLTGTELSAGAAMFHVTEKPIKSLRSNITTLSQTGAGNVFVSILILSTDR
jgi:hypothetical protein